MKLTEKALRARVQALREMKCALADVRGNEDAEQRVAVAAKYVDADNPFAVLASARLELAAGQRIGSDAGIVIEAPNGFHVDVHGEVRVPESMHLRADLKTDLPPR
jgi:hypothetical protein